MTIVLKMLALVMILCGAFSLGISIFRNYSGIDPVYQKLQYCLMSLFVLVVGLYLLVSYW